MGNSYSDPRFGIVREDTLDNYNQNSADAIKTRWHFPKNEIGSNAVFKLLEVAIIPTTAGTSTAALITRILKNGTSIGVVTLNSNTAGARLAPDTALAATCTTGDLITLQSGGSDAAGVFVPQMVYTEQFSGSEV